jgi:hypothetical protein
MTRSAPILVRRIARILSMCALQLRPMLRGSLIQPASSVGHFFTE